MAKIKLTLPGLEIPVDGKQVSFTAPCSCSAVDGIQIDGVDYDLVDSAGNVVPFGRFVWCEGAVLTVTLDVTNRKAYLQNQNAYTRYEALTPATAELFGLGADAVPDDVFGVLSRFQNGLGNEYVWEKVGYEYTPLWGSANSQVNLANSISHSVTVSVTFYSDVFLESGKWVLANEYKTYSGITNGNIQSVLSTTVLQNNGVKYFAGIDGNIYKTVPGTSWAGSSSGASQWTPYIGSVCALTGTNTETASYGYVNSPYADAYPPAVSDGYTYLGPWTVGGGKIATGSYTGTGTYGKNNTTALTFDFVPKFVVVITQYSVQLESYNGFVWTGQVGTGGNILFSVAGNTLSWYTTATSQGAMIQRNDSGNVYYYIAIG